MRILAAALLFLAALAAGPAAAAPDLPLAGDKQQAAAVWSTFERWLGAYKVGDLQGTMAIFDRDVQFAAQGAPDQRYADLEAGYRGDFKTRAPGTEWVPTVQEVYAAGSLAFVRSVWEQRVRDADGRTEIKARNRSIDVLHLDQSGRWLIFRSLNYPEK